MLYFKVEKVFQKRPPMNSSDSDEVPEADRSPRSREGGCGFVFLIFILFRYAITTIIPESNIQFFHIVFLALLFESRKSGPGRRAIRLS